MWKLLLIFIALAHIGDCYCPDGFEIVRDGECRGSIGNLTLIQNEAIETAFAKCNSIQAHPVIIHNDEALCAIPHRLNGSGLMDLPPPCKTGESFFIQSNGVWMGWTGDNPFNVDISCTKQADIPLNDDACEYFEDDAEDGVCYQVGATAKNFQDAQIICMKLGANLASVHNEQENTFLRRLAVSKGVVTGLLLGATISGKEDKFEWIDGSDWDYDNFAPGFPRSEFGDCIVMDTSTSSGQWKNIEYSETYPVACIRKQKILATPVCSNETWKEGAIITSPGFPHNASTPCDFYLLVEEGKRVEVEIILLEAISCCDNFILYDGYVGGVVLANLTGAISNAT